MIKVCVVPVGPLQTERLDDAERFVRMVFGFPTERLSPLPDAAFAYDEHRSQYSSSLILKELAQSLPPGVGRLVGITEYDIFIPMLKFVFGQAQLGGTTALISLARLRQEFYGMPPDEELMTIRLRKVVVHELGHTFGLTHCSDARCVMILSTNLEQLDAKLDAFCESCELILRDRVSKYDQE